ncbi:flagellar biosynthesis protein FlhF [Metallumcola ferriviriculae]|uniref:Flagellar biosynthesis protein FlhF n=1 Tax=Metallumcola ferriviriculae TaxID=3039180 RepID=A0AAU0UUK2_9FIRM|nr:flagellar biosynthesis protein FlhF [Desulfitibacteraceae bacterium MK1]
MKIKRYIVRNMHEGFSVIRQDLGPDAIIISSKKVRDEGLLGLFRPKKLEVTAAITKQTEQVEQSQEKEERVMSQKQDRLETELAEMKQMLVNLAATNSSVSVRQDKWEEILLSLEIEPHLAAQLAEKLKQANGETADDMIEQLLAQITPMLDKKKEINNKIIAFVGPTGVGKTTTIAKLAAQYVLHHGQKVALATIDTYRIGAVEQLKTYSEIIGIPIEVAMTPHELKKIITNHSDKDVILVDTAGRSSKNTMQVMELRNFLEQIKPAEVCLVLSCTTRAKDLLRIVEDFRQVDYTSLIFTKVDETETLGSILNIVQHTDLPVRYIANGQNVPDDIEAVEPQRLARLILEAVKDA